MSEEARRLIKEHLIGYFTPMTFNEMELQDSVNECLRDQTSLGYKIAKASTIVTAKEKLEDRRKIYNRFGIGFIGKNPSGNHFENHHLFKELETIIKELEA